MDIFDWEKKLDDLNVLNSNKINVIFGAGIVGSLILKLCTKRNFKITCFCDNAIGQGENSTFCDLSVHTLPFLKQQYGKNINFIVSVRSIEDIKKQLNDEYKIYPAHVFFDIDDIPSELSFLDKQKIEWTYYVHKYFYDDVNVNLRTLDLVITEKCSLRCRECSNLMQYYQKPQNFSLLELQKEIEQLMRICNEIYEIRVIGGEPLVHPQFVDIIEYLHSFETIKRICVYTNATIALSEDILKRLAFTRKKTWFSISDYGTLSRNLQKLVDSLESHNLDYVVKDIDYWTSCSSLVKQNRTVAQEKQIYDECCVKDLLTIIKGKIYPCPFIGNAINLKAIPSNVSDYVDIFQNDVSIEQLRKKINNTLFNRPYFHSCDYCQGRPDFLHVTEEDKIPPHEQISKPLPYEILE